MANLTVRGISEDDFEVLATAKAKSREKTWNKALAKICKEWIEMKAKEKEHEDEAR